MTTAQTTDLASWLLEADPRFAERRHVSEAGCWEWVGSRTEHGYGRMSWKGRVRGVHRVVAHLVYGLDLDSTLNACHHCDNPSCFRPDHLFVGSQRDNVADMMTKGRWGGGGQPHETCAKGHPLEGDNVRPVNPAKGRGKRRCRECSRIQQRLAAERKRSAETGEPIRWDVVNQPRRPVGEVRHGTYYAYARHRCRCDDCRAANTEHDRRYRARRAAREAS